MVKKQAGPVPDGSWDYIRALAVLRASGSRALGLQERRGLWVSIRVCGVGCLVTLYAGELEALVAKTAESSGLPSKARV